MAVHARDWVGLRGEGWDLMISGGWDDLVDSNDIFVP